MPLLFLSSLPSLWPGASHLRLRMPCLMTWRKQGFTISCLILATIRKHPPSRKCCEVTASHGSSLKHAKKPVAYYVYKAWVLPTWDKAVEGYHLQYQRLGFRTKSLSCSPPLTQIEPFVHQIWNSTTQDRTYWMCFLFFYVLLKSSASSHCFQTFLPPCNIKGTGPCVASL